MTKVTNPPARLQGWKAIHAHVCERLGREFSFETVRKWSWLGPALDVLNDRVAADVDALDALLDARRLARAEGAGTDVEAE